MFKFFEPNKIFQVTSKAPKYVLFLFIIVFSIGLTEALILSPEDYKQIPREIQAAGTCTYIILTE